MLLDDGDADEEEEGEEERLFIPIIVVYGCCGYLSYGIWTYKKKRDHLLRASTGEILDPL